MVRALAPHVELVEQRRLAALRAGDDAAFGRLVDELSPVLLPVARTYVPTAALAEDVVQETWIGVLRGLRRFEGRSSLKTWVFRILVNIAKTRAVQERRTTPFSCALGGEEAGEAPVEPERFLGSDDRYAGHWTVPPQRWDPDAALLADETRAAVVRAIEALPPAQRTVVTMRDVAGCESAEVCEALAISPENQRVLLHRGRSRVRNAIERELGAMVT